MIKLAAFLLCIVIVAGKEFNLEEILQGHSCDDDGTHCINKRQVQSNTDQCPDFLDTIMYMALDNKPKEGTPEPDVPEAHHIFRLPITTTEFFQLPLDDKSKQSDREKKILIADVIAGGTDAKIVFEHDNGSMSMRLVCPPSTRTLIEPYPQNGGKFLMCARQQYKGVGDTELKTCINCQLFNLGPNIDISRYGSNLYDVKQLKTTRAETTIRYDFGQLPLEIDFIETSVIEDNPEPRCERWTSNKHQPNNINSPTEFSSEVVVVNGLVAKKAYTIESRAFVQRPESAESLLPEKIWVKYNSILKIAKGDCEHLESVEDISPHGPDVGGGEKIDGHAGHHMLAAGVGHISGIFTLISMMVVKLLSAQ